MARPQTSKEIIEDYLVDITKDIRGEKLKSAQKLFRAMQQQHLLRKILKEESALANRSVLDETDMLRACQIGVEGLDNIMEEVNDKFELLKRKVTLKTYKKVIAPLGNYILGYKTIKEYCPKYIKPNNMIELKRIYDDAKKRLHVLDDSVDKQIEDKYSTTLHRHFGIEPMSKKSQKETIYNVDNIYNLKEATDFLIVDHIIEYEKKTGKNAIWRGAKTTPFIRYLRKNLSVKEKELLEDDS